MSKNHNIQAIYSLSPMQEGLFFQTLYAPHSRVYFEQVSCTLGKDLDVPILKQAWQHVVERHPVLRTLFAWGGKDKLVQIVRQRVELPWEDYDWRGLPSTVQKEQLEEFLQADQYKGFNLAEAPLMRVTLIRMAEDSYHFIWSYHHLLLDGWSVPLVLGEVFACYETLCRGQTISLKPASPFQNYISWLKRQDLSQAETFWRQTLKGFTAPTPLGVDQAPGSLPDQQERFEEQRLDLSETATGALQTLARQHHLTLNTLLQGAWALLLHCYSGEKDLVFGVTVSGRPADLAGVETMVGLFINTLPMRVQVSPQALLLPWLKELQARQIELKQYEYSPLVQVQGWSDVPGGVPLFDSILVFENYPVDSSLQAQNGNLEIRDVRFYERTHYPLTILAAVGSSLSLRIMYNSRRFDDATISRMLGHLQNLLAAMAANPSVRLAGLRLLTEAEQQQLLIDWNDTQADYPEGSCLHQLVEAQVERTPNAEAVVFEGKRLTYQALNQRANQVAHYLQKLGVGPEVCVGICMERSLELVIGLLGILKAGGAYVPLDPSYPQERLAFMLEDAQVPVMLSQEHLVPELPNHQAKVFCLDTDWATVARENIDNPLSKAAPEDLAYVIYTSGSTGKPKGAMNTHQAICNRLLWMQDAYQLTEADRVLQKTPFSFDVSVWEFFWPLLTGACLVVARPGGHQDSAYLVKLIVEQDITTMHFVPSMLQMFIEEEGIEACHSLKRVICSGEALPFDLQERFFARLPAELHNLYGPTEAAIDVTFWQCQRESAWRIVPIGYPIANIQTYVLDPHLQPVPIGVPGELHIGGVGLARGYLKRAELTAEKFIPNPFPLPSSPSTCGEGTGEGRRLYKTGDLARYLPDGSIEFLGRLDHQVKIHGFRIELGEIEAVLERHPAVREAVVIDQEDGRYPGDREASLVDKRLVAYVVPPRGQTPSISDLRRFVQEKLPKHMAPSAFVLLEALPLTPNGKVNRRLLPKPDQGQLEPTETFAMPRNDIERKLAQIWSEVLEIERIGIEDNFFELGGDSFKAIRIVRRLGEDVGVIDLFKNPTIRELAAFITADDETDNTILQELTTSSGDKDLSLVCIPYGGGSAICYQPLANALPENYAVYAVALPGHDFSRPDEELKPLEEVARLCVKEIKEEIKGPLVLYGQCVGVALTVEIARLLEAANIKIEGVFLGAAFPFPEQRFLGISPAKIFDRPTSDEELFERLKRLGGFEEVLEASDVEFVMRNFRHDVEEATTYFSRVYETEDILKLKAPILCIAGDKDPLTWDYQNMFKKWEDFSDAVSLVVVKDGGHYFIKHQAGLLGRIITKTLHNMTFNLPSSSIPEQVPLPKREFTIADEYHYNRSGVISWILSHVSQYKFHLTSYILGRISWNALTAVIPILMGIAFNEVLQGDRDAGRLLTISLGILGVVLLRGVIGLGASVSIETLGQRLQRDTRKELYLNLLGKSQTFHNRQRVGDIMARTANDVRQLTPMVSPGFALLFDSLLSLIIPLIFIAFIRPVLLLSPLIFMVFFVRALLKYVGKLGPVAGQMQAQFGRMNADLVETITGIEVVKSAAQEPQETHKFEEHANRYRDLFVQEGQIRARYVPPLLLAITFVGAFLHGLFLFSRGQLLVGDFVAYLALIGTLRTSILLPIFTLALIQLGVAGAQRILAVINEETELDENQAGYRADIKGEIIFENVTFSYDGDPVLKNVSFHAEPGQTIAIVGQTGSGKSSLAKLVNRLYDVDEGRILIDGIDVRAWNLDALRSQISSIEQDVFLFSRSIRENIAFGLGQQADHEAIEQATKEAQAHDFIVGFKEGYATIVGERGVNLSGGQRQRLAIARALLTDPRILILDDSTSAIDSATEDKIQKAIRRVLRGRTTLLITHRLSQIQQADRILVLKQGELVDQGTHIELLARCELYRRIFAPYGVDYLSEAPESLFMEQVIN